MPDDHLILDASVLVELITDGRHRPAAERLLQRIATDAELTLVTAAHGLVESASAIRRLVFRERISPGAGTAALRALGDFELALDLTALRLQRIWELRDTMTTYDAAYAAAAEAYELPLITTDARLLRSCRAVGIPAMHFEDMTFEAPSRGVTQHK